MAKNKFFKVQISDELYNDFINKCLEKYLSKDTLLGFIIKLKINKKNCIECSFFYCLFLFLVFPKNKTL